MQNEKTIKEHRTPRQGAKEECCKRARKGTAKVNNHKFSQVHTIRVWLVMVEPLQGLGVGPCTMEPLILKLLTEK